MKHAMMTTKVEDCIEGECGIFELFLKGFGISGLWVLDREKYRKHNRDDQPDNWLLVRHYTGFLASLPTNQFPSQSSRSGF